MIAMLNYLKKEANETYTENGAKAFVSAGSDCLDLFFKAGAMRNADENTVRQAVAKAYAENPDKTMKIIFFARDVRGGLGERRFFRIAVKYAAEYAADSVKKNIPLFAEYGRYDDLCVLLDTQCKEAAAEEIKARLDKDIAAMVDGKPASLLAKWLPSVNASSKETVRLGKKLCRLLGMNEKDYRITLAQLRKYTDIIENRLRVMDYTFDYSKQPSGAMFKYRKAFCRNDGERYREFITSVERGEQTLHAGTLYPYEIVRACLESDISDDERKTLDATWKSLSDFGGEADTAANSRAIAVVDGSGSMTWSASENIRPIDAALSLGIYFAEHNNGAFGGHFITFSQKPRLVEIKGRDITEKVRYCAGYDECANTNLEAVFELILRTALKNKLPAAELPDRLYIISDMEFDFCIEGGNNFTLFEAMKRKYARFGYRLPDIVFWNVNSRCSHIPVTVSDTGAALVSGCTPAIFGMVKSGNLSPAVIMNDIIGSERYKAVSA